MDPFLCTVCLTANENQGYGPVSVTIIADGPPAPPSMSWSDGSMRSGDRYNLRMGATPMAEAWADPRVERDSFRDASGEILAMRAIAIVGMSSRCSRHLTVAWPMNDPYAGWPQNLRPRR